MEPITNINVTFLNSLQRAGVRFLIAVPSECGSSEGLFPPEDILLFLEDKEALYAKHYGITKNQYRDWTEEGYAVTCSATTKRGKPCRNLVPGGFQVSPKRWLELQGHYCDLHEGERSPRR